MNTSTVIKTAVFVLIVVGGLGAAAMLYNNYFMSGSKDLNEIKDGVKHMQEKDAEHDRKILGAEGRIEVLERKAEDLQKQVRDQRKLLQSFEDGLGANKAALDAEKKKLEALESSLNATRTELDAFKLNLAESDARIDKARQDFERRSMDQDKKLQGLEEQVRELQRILGKAASN